MPARSRGGATNSEEVPLIDGENASEHEDFDAETRKNNGIKNHKPYPKCVFFILGNEFCERYSYYGMRTILVLYLKYYLDMSDDTATAIYHAFTVLAYLFPLMGAFIADSWLGKYKTILYLSIVYAIGMVLNTMGACPPIGNLTAHTVLSMVGLFVIAVGTGGIKPCVSSFGGDQFEPEQEQYRKSFFSLFYFAINAGSLVSTIVSPIIRDDVECLGRTDCYALAFGIPAALMVIAIVTFVIGTPYYKIKPPEGNVFAEVFNGMGSAIKHRWNTPRKQRNKEHWMDYALVDTSAKMVRDIKYVLRVLILYIPLPLFWTLFDQQGSRWTLQATRMDGYVGSIRIKPDQMQVFNPLLIVTMIPLFEATLYPCLRKLNINFSPLKRMTLGMILAGISFVLAAIVQLQMDETLTVIPEYNSEASLRIINAANCELTIKSDVYEEWKDTNGGFQLPSGNATNTLEMLVDKDLINEKSQVDYVCTDKPSVHGNVEVVIGKKATWTLVISDDGVGNLKDKLFEGIFEKSEDGGAIIRVFNTMSYSINIKGLGKEFTVTENNISESQDLERKQYDLGVVDISNDQTIGTFSYYLDTGGVYTVVIREESTGEGSGSVPPTDTSHSVTSDIYIDVNPNTVNIFWMIPQYFVITLGEVFLSVTGLEFSYSQAPTSMKSVLASFWLLTVSLGNIIVLIIAEAKFVPSQADEYFLFAGLIGIAAIIFIILAIRYEYVDESEFYETEDEPLDAKREYTEFSSPDDFGITKDGHTEKEKNGNVNSAFDDDDNDHSTPF